MTTRAVGRRTRPGLIVTVTAVVVLGVAGWAGPPAGAARSASARGTVIAVTPDTVTRIAYVPSSTAVPADGRLRGDGYAATIDGVATGPRTATARAGPGQQLWQFGLTYTTSPPATGGSPVTLGAALSDGSTTVPVALPAPEVPGATVGTVWYQASLPVTGSDDAVVLSLSAVGSTQGFSLTAMARTGPTPTAVYRDPTGPTVATKPGQTDNIPTAYADGDPDHAMNVPIRATLDTATLGYWAPDISDHTAATPSSAWLWVTLDSNPAPGQNAFSNPYLIVRQPIPATAITLTVPGQPAQTATDVPGGGGDNGSDAATSNPFQNTTDGFPDTYLFAVPATLTTATVTVTPGPTPATLSTVAGGLIGTATPTPATANATFNLTLPAPVTHTSPPAASAKPGVLNAHSTPQASTGGGTPILRAPSVPTNPIHFVADSIAATLLVLALIVVAGIVLIVIVYQRHHRPRIGPHPALATPSPPAPPTGWAAPPGPAWGQPAPEPGPPDRPDHPAPTVAHPPQPGPPATDKPTTHSPLAAPSPLAGVPSPTASPGPDPAPIGLPGSYPPPDLPAPAIRVLGSLALEGWANPPTASNLIELSVRLATAHKPVPADTLRTDLSPRADTDLTKGTIRVYCSSLRAHLDPGVELTSTASGYQLTGINTDLATFTTLTGLSHANSENEIDHLGQALALITGPAYAGVDYRWADTETITGQARTAALRLADLTANTNPALARWACRQAILTNRSDVGLAAATLTAAAHCPEPGALTDEWAATIRRFQAVGVPLDPSLTAHHQRLAHDTQPAPPQRT